MANKSRPHQIVIRCNDAEYNRIKMLVAKSGLNQQEFLVQAILNTEIISTAAIKQAIPEISRVGNNLNQIARKLNSLGQYDLDELTTALKGCDEVWRLLRSLVVRQQ